MKHSISIFSLLALAGSASAAVVTNGFVQNKEQNWSHLSGAVASQKTLGSGGVPARAIDDNYNGAWSGNSVTHTNSSDTANWWQVDLGAARPISEVTLFNRTDSCCTGRLSNYSVLASNDATFLTPHIYDSGNIATAPTGPSVGFSPTDLTAQFVRVQRNATSIHGDQVISLAEVDVKGQVASYRNLAIGSTAAQSSLAAGGVAGRAIDGNTDGNYNGANSTTHTDPNATGAVYWETTLATLSRINEISLYNRGDCCGDRLGNFRVSIFNGAVVDFSQDYFVGSGSVAQGGIFSIQEDTGGFLGTGDRVRVELIGGVNNSGTPRVLSLTEVEIYGVPEPSSTLALVGLSSLGLILRRRRK